MTELKKMSQMSQTSNPMTSQHTATVSLPSDTTILITREFAAPKHLVFRTWTEPELIKRWWAGQRGTVGIISGQGVSHAGEEI